jgi:signal transduction histidine kinase/CheY-like chemotaxis protein
MALPLAVGDEVIGALTVQSTEEAAFSDEDITSLQAMADQLAVALHNARLLRDLEAAHAELVRTKTFEALATATIEAIHWIGNKALPISNSAARLREDLQELAQADPQQVASMQEDLTLIEDSARLIGAVQEHLVGPAREQKPRPVMVEDVVKDTIVPMSAPDVELRVAPEVPLARADTTQLSRAVGYVLQNALEATEELPERRITVEIGPAEGGEFVSIRVSDNGPGIPEDELDKIWAAFYTTKGAQHAGLGLSAVLQIVEQLEGRVAAANGPQGGAVFEIQLPAFEGTLPRAELPSGRSVLLVDDADAWSDFAASALVEAGNTVARSKDGRVDPAPYDLVIVDDVLEGAANDEVLQRLVEADTGERVIVVASNLRVERAMELMGLGAQDVLPKPYTPAGLAEVVRP